MPTGHEGLEEGSCRGARRLVPQADGVVQASSAEHLLRAREGGLAGGELCDRTPVIGNQLVGAVEIGSVGRDAHAGADPGRVDWHAAGHEPSEVVLVEAARDEDPYPRQPRSVEHAPSLPSQGAQITAVETNSGSILEAKLADDLDGMGDAGEGVVDVDQERGALGEIRDLRLSGIHTGSIAEGPPMPSGMRPV